MVVDLDEVLLQLIVHLSFHKTLFWQVQQPMQYLFATCSNVIWLFIFFPAQEYRQHENPTVDIFQTKRKQ